MLSDFAFAPSVAISFSPDLSSLACTCFIFSTQQTIHLEQCSTQKQSRTQLYCCPMLQSQGWESPDLDHFPCHSKQLTSMHIVDKHVLSVREAVQLGTALYVKLSYADNLTLPFFGSGRFWPSFSCQTRCSWLSMRLWSASTLQINSSYVFDSRSVRRNRKPVYRLCCLALTVCALPADHRCQIYS